MAHPHAVAEGGQPERCGIKTHPARFPSVLPEFFTRLLTDRGDLVLDPFAGSNTTGKVAEDLGRVWIAMDLEEEYVQASALRFDIDPFGDRAG